MPDVVVISWQEEVDMLLVEYLHIIKQMEEPPGLYHLDDRRADLHKLIADTFTHLSVY